MNPHDDPRESRWIKNVDNQKRSCHGPSSREEENKQRYTRREQPGVLGHKSIPRAMARLDPARREEENITNTSQRATQD